MRFPQSSPAIGPLPENFYPANSSSPMRWSTALTGAGFWLVEDYRLARKLLGDPRLSRSAAVDQKAPKVLLHNSSANAIISLEGPAHTRIRQLVASEFTERKMAELEPFISQTTERALDELEAQGSPADFVSHVSVPLPLQVICHVLGIPPADRKIFGSWVNVLFRLEGHAVENRRHGVALARYMTELIAEKRRRPGNDLISHLIESSGAGITNRELITLCLSLLMAGYDTTVDQATLCVFWILLDRSLLQALSERPVLVPRAVEELMRLNPAPFMTFARMATDFIHAGESVIEPGQLVVISIVGSNRDEKSFELADEVMLDQVVPGHLTFGHGAHWCLGAPLARLQLSTLLATLLRRFPGMRIDEELNSLDWKTGMATRGLNRMRVSW
jgi:cytochrome P450